MRSTDVTDTTKGCFQEFSIEQPSIEKSGQEGKIASVASEPEAGPSGPRVTRSAALSPQNAKHDTRGPIFMCSVSRFSVKHRENIIASPRIRPESEHAQHVDCLTFAIIFSESYDCRLTRDVISAAVSNTSSSATSAGVVSHCNPRT
jgi:hypothetical protein